MTYLEIVGLVVSGAGTLASILGIFFAVYAKHNGRLTREFLSGVITSQNKEMREFLSGVITSQNKEMREFLSGVITSQNKEMREFLGEVLTKLDQKAEIRHRETLDSLKR